MPRYPVLREDWISWHFAVVRSMFELEKLSAAGAKRDKARELHKTRDKFPTRVPLSSNLNSQQTKNVSPCAGVIVSRSMAIGKACLRCFTHDG
jgi:hypothetical protein